MTASSSAAAYSGTRATTSRATGSGGKYYWEVQINAGGNNATSDLALGFATSGCSVDSYPGNGAQPNSGAFYYNGIASSGAKWCYTAVDGPAYTTFDSAFADSSTGVVRFAVDMSAGKMWVGFGGAWDNSGDPAAGTNPQFTGLSGTYFPMVSMYKRDISQQLTLNTGATSWQAGGGPPSGFSAWDATSAANAATMALTEAQDVMASIGTAVATDTGTLSGTDTQDSASVVGTFLGLITGSFAVTGAQDTFVINGTHFSAVTGSIAATGTPDTFAAILQTTMATRLFVACGYGNSNVGFVSTSPDGATWTQRATFAGTVLNDVHQSAANGYFIAVGRDASSNGKMFKSADLDTWSAVTLPAGTKTLNAVHYNGTIWVACSNTGQFLTSSDGETWTIVYTGTFAPQDVSFGNIWVAVANGGRFYYSSDGSSWNVSTLPVTGSNMFGIAWNGTNLWVATGQSGKLCTSPDGVNWTARTSGTTANINSVAYGEGTWVGACGASVYVASVIKSTNGTTWTSSSLSSTSGQLQSVIHNDNTDVWVTVGQKATTSAPPIYTSADASSWTSQSAGAGVMTTVALGTYITGLSVFGSLAGTESPDVVAINGVLPSAVYGTFTLTETPDTLTFTGFSNVTATVNMTLTEAKDVGAFAGVKVLPNNPGSFALTEAADSVSFAGFSVITRNIVWIVATDTPDTVAMRMSGTIHGSIVSTETPDEASFTQTGAGLSLRVTAATADQFTAFDASLFDGGILRIYSGSQPTSAEDAPTGTLLGEIPLSDPAFGDVENGTATQAQTWSGSATNDGVAGWFRLYDATFTYWVDGSVGSANADLIASNTSFQIGDPLVVTGALFQLIFLNE